MNIQQTIRNASNNKLKKLRDKIERELNIRQILPNGMRICISKSYYEFLTLGYQLRYGKNNKLKIKNKRGLYKAEYPLFKEYANRKYLKTLPKIK